MKKRKGFKGKDVLSIVGVICVLVVVGVSIGNKSNSIQTVSSQSSPVAEDNESKDSVAITEKEKQIEEKIPEPQEVYGGLFTKEAYSQAQQRLETMTIEEKVGQMLLARCPGEGAIEGLQNYKLGGFVLFKPDFEGKTKEEVVTMTTSFQEASKIPMTIAVDEEGGTVVRISSNPNLSPTKFQSPSELYEQGGMAAIEEDTTNKAKLLKELGITMNLAPVADVSTSPKDYIYYRTLGRDVMEVATYVATVVEANQREELDSTLKHFPGYGGNVDTHIGIAYDTRTYEELVQEDFLPFQAGIEAGVHSILVSHNIVEAIDPEHPASLSSKVIEVLRDQLGFQGIIMTDDLEMEAAKSFVGEVHPAVQAVLAGNDLLIITDYSDGHQEMVKAVKDGIIDEAVIDEAVLRILTWKYNKNSSPSIKK